MPELEAVGSERVADALADIYGRYGYLTPELLLEEAKDRNHPLHPDFEWNNKEAGHQWRLVQARRLIRSVKVAFVSDRQVEEKIRNWHVVRAPERSYRPLPEIAEDEFVSELVRRDMERRWRQLFARYKVYEEFIGMVRRDLGVDDGNTGTDG
jgi:hypothetical protein